MSARSAEWGTVIVGMRCAPDQPKRARNARTSLLALQRQSIARSRYRVVVLEQDEVPRCREALADLVDEYHFLFNPGPYNRAWGFNAGANLAGMAGPLCFFDADLVVPRDFLETCFGSYVARRGRWPGGAGALRPHSSVEFLDGPTSERLASAVAGGAFHLGRYRGNPWESFGCCICVDAGLYHEMGGHDERFHGWGKEDKEFWARLKRFTKVSVLDRRLVHLHHESAARYDDLAEGNRRLYALKQAGEDGWPDGPVGDPLRYSR